MAEEIKDEKVNPEAEEVKTDEVKPEEKAEETKKEKKSKSKEQIEELNNKIKALEAEKADLKNEYLKALASVENTKKRLNDEAIQNRKYASQKLVGELINPIDMFLQVLNMPAPSPEIQNYLYGFQMIATQITDALKADGLSAIECLGKEFDPVKMHAMQTEETDGDENIVLKVLQPGYMYKDRVLRPAMVVVSKKKEIKENEDK